MSDHLWAVQDATGREVTSWSGEAKVTEVTAARHANTVVIEHQGEVVARGQAPAGTDVVLLRWPAYNKLAKPVRRKVTQR